MFERIKNWSKEYKVEKNIILIFSLFTLILVIIAFDIGRFDFLIDYTGAIMGSLLGIAGAYFVLRYQLKKEDERLEIEKKPYIIASEIVIKEISYILTNKIQPDSFNLGEVKQSESKIFTIPLVNAGETPIYDIKYRYIITNLDHLKDEFNRIDNNKNEVVPDPYIKFYEKQSVDDPLGKLAPEVIPCTFTVYSKGVTDYPMIEEEYSVAVILKGETQYLEVPEFIALLWRFQYHHEEIKPEIKVLVEFNNYLHERQNHSFIVNAVPKSANVNNSTVTFNLKITEQFDLPFLYRDTTDKLRGELLVSSNKTNISKEIKNIQTNKSYSFEEKLNAINNFYNPNDFDNDTLIKRLRELEHGKPLIKHIYIAYIGLIIGLLIPISEFINFIIDYLTEHSIGLILKIISPIIILLKVSVFIAFILQFLNSLYIKYIRRNAIDDYLLIKEKDIIGNILDNRFKI